MDQCSTWIPFVPDTNTHWFAFSDNMAFALIFNVLGIKVLVADDDLGGIKHGGWYVQSDFFP